MDADGLTTETLLAGYDGIIEAELASLEEVAIDAAQEGHTLGAAFRAYDAAVIGKELAAEERAVTLASLANGGLTPEALATVSRLQGGEAAAFAFLDHTKEPAISEVWTAFLASPEHRAVVELRAAITAGGAPPMEVWYEAASRRAEALHNLEMEWSWNGPGMVLEWSGMVVEWSWNGPGMVLECIVLYCSVLFWSWNGPGMVLEW